MLATSLSVFIALALICPACSDDDTPTPDKGIADKGVDTVTPDTGPGMETGPNETGPQETMPDQGQKTIGDYVPAPGDVAGWSEDTSQGDPGVQETTDEATIYLWIDGHHGPYANEGCAGFALEYYKKDTFTLRIELWEMNTATGAKNMFDANKKELVDNGVTPEDVPGVPDETTIGNDNPQWKLYGHKGVYTYLIYATFPDYGQAATLKPDVIAFAEKLTGNLP